MASLPDSTPTSLPFWKITHTLHMDVHIQTGQFGSAFADSISFSRFVPYNTLFDWRSRSTTIMSYMFAFTFCYYFILQFDYYIVLSFVPSSGLVLLSVFHLVSPSSPEPYLDQLNSPISPRAFNVKVAPLSKFGFWGVPLFWERGNFINLCYRDQLAFLCLPCPNIIIIIRLTSLVDGHYHTLFPYS